MHVKVYVPAEQQLLTESVWRAHDGEDHGEEHEADLHLLPVTVSAHTAQPTPVSPPSRNATHTQLHLSSTPPEHYTSDHWPFLRNGQNVRTLKVTEIESEDRELQLIVQVTKSPHAPEIFAHLSPIKPR